MFRFWMRTKSEGLREDYVDIGPANRQLLDPESCTFLQDAEREFYMFGDIFVDVGVSDTTQKEAGQ